MVLLDRLGRLAVVARARFLICLDTRESLLTLAYNHTRLDLSNANPQHLTRNPPMLNPFNLPTIPPYDPDHESWEVTSLTVTHESGHTFLVSIGYDEPGVFGRYLAISVELLNDSSVNSHMVDIPNSEESIRKAIESCVDYVMSKI